MSLQKYFTRTILMGTIWGLVEVFLSPIIKSITPHLFSVIMPSIAIVIILIGRYFVPYFGSTISMGIIAAFVEYMLGGMLLDGAFMAIILEAVFCELILSVVGFNLWSFVLSCITILDYSVLHPLIKKGVSCQSMQHIFVKNLLHTLFIFDKSVLTAVDITFILLAFHTIIGMFLGFLFYFLFQKISITEKEFA